MHKNNHNNCPKEVPANEEALGAEKTKLLPASAQTLTSGGSS